MTEKVQPLQPLSRKHQLPLMLQSQKYDISCGMGVQNDVLANDILSQGGQAGLFGKEKNSAGFKLRLCRFWREESCWPTTGGRPRQYRNHFPEFRFQRFHPGIGGIRILKLEELAGSVQVRQEIRCSFDLGIHRQGHQDKAFRTSSLDTRCPEMSSRKPASASVSRIRLACSSSSMW